MIKTLLPEIDKKGVWQIFMMNLVEFLFPKTVKNLQQEAVLLTTKVVAETAMKSATGIAYFKRAGSPKLDPGTGEQGMKQEADLRRIVYDAEKILSTLHVRLGVIASKYEAKHGYGEEMAKAWKEEHQNLASLLKRSL